MSSEPDPADPGREDGPAWPDRDPMPAADRGAWLDHLAASDDPPEDEEDSEPLTAEELAGLRESVAPASPLAPLVAAEGRRGRASEQFANRNRITLINGAELKQLIKEYLHKDVI